jgi:EmrB/QacA subfamily drug resistance transporter
MELPLSRSMIVPMIVASALFMENLDGTIITTALPQMAESFATTPIHLSIGITAYVLSLAVFIPVSGWVADRFGAKTIFRSAIAVFTIGSILCGICSSVSEFAAARILQGIGGAMMVPVGRLIMFRSVPRSEFVAAMAYLTVPALVGPILGPPVGGFITTYASWRWIFFLNLPVGLLGIFLVSTFIENYREPESPSLDWIGFLLSGTAIASLVFDFDLVERPDASIGLLLLLLGISIAAGLAAAWHIRHRDHPVIDPTLLRIQTFSVSVLGGSLFRVGTASLNYLLPILLQIGIGMTAFTSGLLTLASAAGSFVMKIAALRILRRWGFRTVLLVNGAISAASVLVCVTFTENTSLAVIFFVLLIGGFFRSLHYTALNSMAFADVSVPRMSAATSFSSMVQQISNGMGVAVAAVVLNWVLIWRGESLTEIPLAAIQITLVIMTVLTLSSCLYFVRLAPDAAAEVSGHRRAGVQAEASTNSD